MRHQRRRYNISSYRRKRITTPAATLGLALIFVGPKRIEALSCTDSSECISFIHPDSSCIENVCSNPFSKGCLRNYNGPIADDQGIDYGLRVCNSDDPPQALKRGLCRPSRFNLTEVRLYPGNWETSMFYTWVVQILLSEILDVPVSIELGHGIATPDESKPSLNFYSEDNSFPYSTSGYNFAAVKEADRLGDCLQTKNTSEPCAHGMMEVWNGQEKAWTTANEEGYVDPPEGDGMVGKIGWFIPSFVAERHEEIVSFHGLRNNREKLAGLFKRPYTWENYCRLLSPTNCSSTVYDGVAWRWPETQAEGAKYYASGLYTGHFANTTKNNCTANPTTCSGHIVDAPCHWSTNTEQQAYWNNIYLESDGPLEPNGGYSYGSMIEIWRAANETKSNVMMWWFKPDGLLLDFVDTQAEFQIVTLPPPSKHCLETRVGPGDNGRCSKDISVRRGIEAGNCDNDHHALQKLISQDLYRNTYDVPPPRRSPAYDAIKSIQITDLQMDVILKAWIRRKVDQYGYDGRDAVCGWVNDNLDDLMRFIPRGYPRILDDSKPYEQSYLYAAMAVGITVIIIVSSAAFATFYWRKKRIIRTASYPFLMLTLSGFFFVSVGAVLFSTAPSSPSCELRQWLVTMGYTLGLVPLVVKVAAINKLDRGARRMKRVTLTQRYLFSVVVSIVVLVVIYLGIWTILDTPTRKEEWTLTNEDSKVITIDVDCSSDSQVWLYISLAIEMVLCLSACVLSFQARKVRQEFNESHLLFSIAFSHCAFMLMRVVTYILSSTVQSNVRAAVASFLLSFDTLAAVCIYFVPKFVVAAKGKDGGSNRSSTLRSDVYVSQQTFTPSILENARTSSGGNSIEEKRVTFSECVKDITKSPVPSKPHIRDGNIGISRSCSIEDDADDSSSSNNSYQPMPTAFPTHSQEQSQQQEQEEDDEEKAEAQQSSSDDSTDKFVENYGSLQSQHQLEIERIQQDAQDEIDQIKAERNSLVQRIKLDAERDVQRLKEEIKLLKDEKVNEGTKGQVTLLSINSL